MEAAKEHMHVLRSVLNFFSVRDLGYYEDREK